MAAWQTLATSGTTTRRSGCVSNAKAITGVRDDMTRLLLDTTVLIDALRGRPAAGRIGRIRRTGAELWACAISVEEIWRGLLPGEDLHARRLFNGLRLAPLGAAEGRRAGAWRRSFALRGVTLHQADCLIAAAAAGIGAELATANVDDFPMAEIEVQNWPVGA